MDDPKVPDDEEDAPIELDVHSSVLGQTGKGL